MHQDVPTEFVEKIAAFNDHLAGGPVKVAVAWHPQKLRWQVFAIPIAGSSHPDARNDLTRKLARPLPDGSGERGVLIFTWCARDERGTDIGFEPLDDRLFATLHWADSFRSKEHFKQTVEDPELLAERIQKKRLRDIAGAATEYWYRLDNLTMSMNPATRASGDWRARQWWR